MENGNHTFVAQPKYRKRKLCCIRDFPDGCGPFASRIDDPNTFGKSNDTSLKDKELTSDDKSVECDSFNVKKAKTRRNFNKRRLVQSVETFLLYVDHMLISSFKNQSESTKRACSGMHAIEHGNSADADAQEVGNNVQD